MMFPNGPKCKQLLQPKILKKKKASKPTKLLRLELHVQQNLPDGHVPLSLIGLSSAVHVMMHVHSWSQELIKKKYKACPEACKPLLMASDGRGFSSEICCSRMAGSPSSSSNLGIGTPPTNPTTTAATTTKNNPSHESKAKHKAYKFYPGTPQSHASCAWIHL